MRVIPGSHKGGIIQHTQDADKNSVLTLRCELADYTDDTAVFMNLKAARSRSTTTRSFTVRSGTTPAVRIGFTIRYSKTNVKCDLAVNPNFKTYHCAASIASTTIHAARSRNKNTASGRTTATSKRNLRSAPRAGEPAAKCNNRRDPTLGGPRCEAVRGRARHHRSNHEPAVDRVTMLRSLLGPRWAWPCRRAASPGTSPVSYARAAWKRPSPGRRSTPSRWIWPPPLPTRILSSSRDPAGAVTGALDTIRHASERTRL